MVCFGSQRQAAYTPLQICFQKEWHWAKSQRQPRIVDQVALIKRWVLMLPTRLFGFVPRDQLEASRGGGKSPKTWTVKAFIREKA